LDASDIASLLFFSDNSPDGLVRALDGLPANKVCGILLSDLDLNVRIPCFVQMGLIASSTPFVNGRPFTLFFNDEVHSSGAVGVALRTPTFLEPTIYFLGLKPLATGLGVVTQ
jgi:small ligand-binding sensory domain FIST